MWTEDHAALVLRSAPVLRLARYVQTPWQPHALNALLLKARGLNAAEEPPLGLAEFWWESEEELQRSFTDAQARDAYRALIDDEKRFASPRIAPWFSTETLVLAAGSVRA